MNDKNTIDLSNEEAARLEEERNLSDIEIVIDKEIRSNEEYLSYVSQKIDDYEVFDNDDRCGKDEYRKHQKSTEDSIELWNSYKDSPYFSRVDVSKSDDEIKMVLIGYKGISKYSKIYVVDWRDPMGVFHANSPQTEYIVNGEKYKLLLRRHVDIKNAKLIDVNTQYEVDTVSFDGEVIDPFLLSVLRDKRRNYKLTDIVRTIQANQNELLRKPIEENFIIQGCAGSGKTMILFHRLSYVVYNYPQMDFSKFIVLTPNELFNVHVDDLTHKLELEKIRIYTVDQFYAQMARKLGEKDTYTDVSGRKRLKVEPIPEVVESENVLNEEMLKELYSTDFFEKMEDLYINTWQKAMETLSSLGINDYIGDIADVSGNSNYGYDLYQSLKNPITKALSRNSALLNECEKAREDIADADRQIESSDMAFDSINNKLNDTKSTFVKDLNEYEIQYSNVLQKKQEMLQKVETGLMEAKRQRNEMGEQLSNFEDSFSKTIASLKAIKRDKGLLASNEDAVKAINDHFPDILASVKEKDEMFKKVPFYNFGKRSQAKKQLYEANAILDKNIDETINIVSSEHIQRISSLRNSVAELNGTIKELETNKNEISSNTSTERGLNSVRKSIELFNSEEYPDIKNFFESINISDLPASFADYDSSLKGLKDNSRRKRVALELKTKSASILEHNEALLLPQEDVSKLKTALESVNTLDVTCLVSKVEDEIRSVYDKYNQTVRKGAFYRHRMLYKLLVCSLYYDRSDDSHYYLSIDEAQDLGTIEYLLIDMTLGSQTTYNIYGDVNQLVYSYKGITQWDEIPTVYSYSLNFLNENYRNSLEITDYCNKRFDAGVQGIGLRGSDVLVLKFDEALKHLVDIKESTPDLRVAVIIKKGLDEINEHLKEYEDKFVFDTLDSDKISVISVEESKGLEFDSVLVVATNMSVNEQYTAFTRALDNLIVTDLDEASLESMRVKDTEDTPIAEQQIVFVNDESSNEVVEQGSNDIDRESSVEQDNVKLTEDVVRVPLVESKPYIKAFFDNDIQSKELFENLMVDVQTATPDVLMCVSKNYIGFAKQGEKCRVYVVYESNKPFIKFKHLYVKELFISNQIEQYRLAYIQCCKYVNSYPNAIRLKPLVDYNEVDDIKSLSEKYEGIVGPPIIVHKKSWDNSRCFVVESINNNKEIAKGATYVNGNRVDDDQTKWQKSNDKSFTIYNGPNIEKIMSNYTSK